MTVFPNGPCTGVALGFKEDPQELHRGCRSLTVESGKTLPASWLLCRTSAT